MHFKTNVFEKTAGLVVQNCYLTKIDLKYAYFSISIATEDR